jgi:hypothetical protein
MKALSNFEFHSLLDVGGAEGYKAALAREIFDANVKNSTFLKKYPKEPRRFLIWIQTQLNP